MVLRIKKSFVILLAAVICFLSVTVYAFDATGVLSETESDSLPVVMYHQLTKRNSDAGKYVLTVENFEKDLIYLKKRGYHSVTVEELIAYSEGKCDLPDKSVMITFDDGCETVYAYALPLLEKYGFNAVCFIIGSVTDKYTQLNDHNLTYSNLDWNEVKELCEGKTVDIQSHTYDLHSNTSDRSGAKKSKHENFEQYSEFLTADTLKMKERMIESAGKEPLALAYPFGSYSKESKDILRACGVKLTFTCEEKINKIKKAESDWLFGLGRYNRPDGISSEKFFEKMGI